MAKMALSKYLTLFFRSSALCFRPFALVLNILKVVSFIFTVLRLSLLYFIFDLCVLLFLCVFLFFILFLGGDGMGVLRGSVRLTPVLPPPTSPFSYFSSFSSLPLLGENPWPSVGTRTSCPCHTWNRIYKASPDFVKHFSSGHHSLTAAWKYV